MLSRPTAPAQRPDLPVVALRDERDRVVGGLLVGGGGVDLGARAVALDGHLPDLELRRLHALAGRRFITLSQLSPALRTLSMTGLASSSAQTRR